MNKWIIIKFITLNILIFVNVYNTSFSFFFIVVLFCLSSQIILKSALDLILILLRSFCKINYIRCVRQDTRSTSCTFVSISSNTWLVRSKRFNFVCIIKLLTTLLFVIAYKRYFNLCRKITSCTIFVNFCSMWKLEICLKISKTSW